MNQKEIYLKPIGRKFEGVIKTSDNRHLLQEMEEYILTEELLGKTSGKRMLPGFFEELSKKDFDSSVWISGHYGSGKSHLLKILSLVLSNHEFNNKKFGELFLEKTKENPQLHKLIEDALKIPTQTILINILTASDGIDNTNSNDQMLAVFIKIFNQSFGYDSQYPEVAAIERYLVEEGKYEEFKEKYQEKYNKGWVEKGRDNILFNLHELADIYSSIKNISKDDALNTFTSYTNNYKIDANTFIKTVSKYLESKPKDFRLIFCIDEVGMYMADSIEKMRTLQIIAEELSVKTNGQAFLIVTSQNDLDTTIKDFGDSNKNDFSKIGARFAIKLSLTGANSDEVIQKRILAKTDEGTRLLKTIYDTEHNNFRTWFEFGDNSRQYPNFKNQEDFIATFPFIPYQFDLFQTCLKTFSDNNNFTGTNKSVAARSMLEYFQKAANNNREKDLSSIVPFYQLFDNLKEDLKSDVQSSIIEAEKNISNKMHVNVLKALFMVKYIKAFVATPQNLAILLFDSFKTDLNILTKEVQEALNYLESQTYVHKLNNTYEFLTNEEKDIENEIKATEIATTAVGELLFEIIYEDILKDDKFKMPNSTRSFQFGKKIDDNAKGKGSEFYVNFITSLNRNDYDTKTLIAKSLGEATDLFIKLPADSKLMDELSIILKIERYANSSHSNKGDSKKYNIITEKVRQNTQRKSTLVNKLIESIGGATLFQNGVQLNITNKDPKSKITLGLHQLIEVVYPQLKMITSDFNEESIKNILNNPDSGDDISPPEQEVLSSISRKKNANEKVTIKTILDTYAVRPYGWPELGIITIVAKLYKRGKLNFRKDGSVVSENELFKTLINNREYEKVVIDIEANISVKQIKALKELHHEFFNESIQSIDAKTVSKLFKEALAKESNLLTSFLVLKNTFTFLDVLADPIALINALNKQDHPYYYTDFTKFDNELKSYKESTIAELKAFMQGQNKLLWEEMLKFSELEKANLQFISSVKIAELNALRQEKTPYKGNVMKRVKDSLEQLNDELNSLKVTERDKATKEITEFYDKIKSLDEYSKIKPEEQTEILKPFTDTISDIKIEGFIGNIQNAVTRVKNTIYPEQLKLLPQFLSAAQQKKESEQEESLPNSDSNNGPEKETDNDTQATSKPNTIPASIIPKNDIKTTRYTKTTIDTKEDVETYITILKEAYTKLIESNNKIIL
jgi:hypothetical protein